MQVGPKLTYFLFYLFLLTLHSKLPAYISYVVSYITVFPLKMSLIIANETLVTIQAVEIKFLKRMKGVKRTDKYEYFHQHNS